MGRKNKKIICGAIAVICVMAILITVFYIVKNKSTTKEETVITEGNNIKKKDADDGVEKGGSVSEETKDKTQETEENVMDNDRIYMISDANLNSEITDGKVIDIRIVFPDGEDYTVVSHKEIYKRDETGIFVRLDEEEAIRYSSARIDAVNYEGTMLYTDIYVSGGQEKSVPDYPVNINALNHGEWDPNLKESMYSEEAVNRRLTLEGNLAAIIEQK